MTGDPVKSSLFRLALKSTTKSIVSPALVSTDSTFVSALRLFVVFAKAVLPGRHDRFRRLGRRQRFCAGNEPCSQLQLPGCRRPLKHQAVKLLDSAFGIFQRDDPGLFGQRPRTLDDEWT